MTCCLQPLRSPRCFASISGLLFLGAWLASSQAQGQTAIRPDSTLDTAVTQNGHLYEITGGTRPGNGPNLFHSFNRFRIGTGDIARFMGPMGIENILSRVTGGEQSIIDGRLQSAIPGANFYLLNPSGVVFGPNASLDVSGSFHVSTADYLRLADGGMFSARLERQSTLTVAPPVAFGFLSDNSAGIAIQGSTLAVSEGRTIAVVGAEVQIAGGSLKAPNGQIHLASVTAAGEVPANLSDLNAGMVPNFGTVTLSEGARLDASSVQGGGTVVIRGGRLFMEDARIHVATEGNVNGAPIGVDVQVAGEVLLANRAEITTDVGSAVSDLPLSPPATGNAGSIKMGAHTLKVTQGALLGSRALAHTRGDTGHMEITAERVYVSGGGTIDSSTASQTGGTAGRVAIKADTLDVDGGRIQTVTRGAGNAGALDLHVGQLTVSGGGQIDSGARSGSTGQGGTVTVRATEAVTLAGADSGLFSSTASVGNAGAITLEAGRLTLTDGAVISNTTFGPGRGGNVTVKASTALTLAGSDPTTGSSSGIFASARGVGEGAGDSGMMLVEAATVTLTDGAQIGNTNFGSGRGGNVTVRATEAMTLKGFTLVGSAFVPTGINALTFRVGDAGTMLIEAGTLMVMDGAQIGVVTFGTGRGGNVTVRATETVTLKGPSLGGSFLSPGGISAATLGAGDAGTVLVEAGTITVTDGAQLRGGTFGAGRGGNVIVRATETVTLGSPSPVGLLAIPSGIRAMPIGLGGTIAFTVTETALGRVPNGLFTDARGSGPGGDLTLQAPIIHLRDGATIAAASTGTGNAGNILITASDTFLSDRGTLTTAATHGDGGNIRFTAHSLIQLRDSEITATVGGGPETVGGNIQLSSKLLVLENSQIRANAFAGRGGNIQIAAGVFLANPLSQVSASSTLGISGAVDIRAPVADLSGTVTPLAQEFIQATILLRDRCATRLQEGTVSSLVERGRDGVPANPDGVLPSRLYKARAESSKPRKTGRQGRRTTVPSQPGLSYDADGYLQIKDWPTLTISPLAWGQECANR